MKKTYKHPKAKLVNLTKVSIMAGSEVNATATGTTDTVGAKEGGMWNWMEE